MNKENYAVLTWLRISTMELLINIQEILSNFLIVNTEKHLFYCNFFRSNNFKCFKEWCDWDCSWFSWWKLPINYSKYGTEVLISCSVSTYAVDENAQRDVHIYISNKRTATNTMANLFWRTKLNRSEIQTCQGYLYV